MNFSLVFDQSFESGKRQVAFQAVSRSVKQLPVLFQVPNHLLVADAAVDANAADAAGAVVHLGDVDVPSVEVGKNFSAAFEWTRQRIRRTSPAAER